MLFSNYFKIYRKIRRVNGSLRIFHYETNLVDIWYRNEVYKFSGFQWGQTLKIAMGRNKKKRLLSDQKGTSQENLLFSNEI